MRIFSAFIERVEIEKKWLPLIHAELKKYNESVSSLNHNIQANHNDLRKELAGLAAKEAEFINVITSFFAFSRDLETQEIKRKRQEEADMKLGKHDTMF